MTSFPLERGSLPVAAGYHRLSFNALVDKACPLIGTPDEFLATDPVSTYIDTQRGRSAMSQAEGIILRATIAAIDFSDIPTCQLGDEAAKND